MKIGLLRHFKVNHSFPWFCNSEKYDQEYLKYDEANISPNCNKLSVKEYSVCYVSKKKRAVETARHLFGDRIRTTDSLIEVPIKAMFNTRIKLPFLLWNVINRLAWFFNSKRLPETRTTTQERAARFLQEVCQKEDGNVLVVTHAFFILTLKSELQKMGFKGERIINPRNGKLYEFENPRTKDRMYE